jgi:hypothetical protein
MKWNVNEIIIIIIIIIKIIMLIITIIITILIINVFSGIFSNLGTLLPLVHGGGGAGRHYREEWRNGPRLSG